MNRYQYIQERKTVTGTRFYKTVKYPEIPLADTDQYVLSVEGDRLDLLANQFYGDQTLYWVISVANPNLNKNSLFIEPGLQIRVPLAVPDIIQAYNTLNQL